MNRTQEVRGSNPLRSTRGTREPEPDRRSGDVAIAAATIGGLVWITTVLITALRPVGYPGAHRSTLDLHPTILVAFVLMAWAATSLALALRPSFIAWAGTAVSWLAVALFSVNVAVVLATGDDAPVWLTHYSAFFLMALGMAVLGFEALRRRAIPVMAAIVMIAPPLLMPLGNMQDDRVLLWLPLGLASVAVGVVFASGRHSRSGGPPRMGPAGEDGP